jgi:hypothetical protein
LILHPAKWNISLHRKNKFERKQKRRSRRLLRKRLTTVASTVSFEIAFGRRSKIIRTLASCSDSLGMKHRGSIHFTAPEYFSIFDNPEGTLNAISSLAKAMQEYRVSRAHLNFNELVGYDLGANALLSVLVAELSTEGRRIGRLTRWSGTLPRDVSINRFIRSMSIIKRLKVKEGESIALESNKLRVYEYRCRDYVRNMRPRELDRKGRVSVEFANHINNCLATVGKTLTVQARSLLCTYVGEIIDNAEQHSHLHDWVVHGYLDTNVEVPMCEVVIFNFGDSISESFLALPPSSYARERVQPYLERHRNSGWFSADWQEEDLLTVLALQQGISSRSQSGGDTRGNGSVELIEFFQKMHSEWSNGGASEPRMLIVSGATCLDFDGKYRMRNNQDGLKVIAFNAENDLMNRPERSHVRRLDRARFPGTMISLRFALPAASQAVAEPGGTP